MQSRKALWQRPRVGLALGGGGARGLAHIGVLKVFEANRIPIDVIAGTSIGALVGAAYALEPRAQAVEQRAMAFLTSNEFEQSGLELFKKKKEAENFFAQVATYVKERIVINLAHSRPSLVGGWRIVKAVNFILADKTFEELHLPLACVATDLGTGEEIVFREGPIRHAVAASMSIPGFLPPVNFRGYQMVDGAVVAPVPVLACHELGAEIVIAVDVGQTLDGLPEFENVVDIIFRANTITSRRLNHMLLQLADVTIRPNVGGVHWAEFRRASELVAEGERAAAAMLPVLQRLLRQRSRGWKRWLRRNGRRRS
ncbi:MAG: patatin-like phospholipase family protein [candidate division KSB1 bacterium]|nr:patatin-like phospholipase family protein [candidate division KSB1 bacterium]MDZ7273194.1 patatin-like phospholipase family protein [candidate division KSB1 bacterium]MDZ7285296.1 patatin-like phospholipase family protein [candidate division KSB1 bacterium]MDZ7298328.1 patatin-like phospholipase family protein [candidate division KSB1 bacterium]MDZ7349039.1 patatin-like phospholipase family protein [candidate division KSB1 bacterium]